MLNDVVQRVVRFEADQVISHRVEIRLSDTDSTVSADPALVERIIGNLVVDAFRHTRPDSTVWITVDGPSGEAAEPVRLVVEDNGAGVPDEMKNAIFEPFVRAAPADRPGRSWVVLSTPIR